jgi:hypothetical protein
MTARSLIVVPVPVMPLVSFVPFVSLAWIQFVSLACIQNPE